MLNFLYFPMGLLPLNTIWIYIKATGYFLLGALIFIYIPSFNLVSLIMLLTIYGLYLRVEFLRNQIIHLKEQPKPISPHTIPIDHIELIEPLESHQAKFSPPTRTSVETLDTSFGLENGSLDSLPGHKFEGDSKMKEIAYLQFKIDQLEQSLSQKEELKISVQNKIAELYEHMEGLFELEEKISSLQAVCSHLVDVYRSQSEVQARRKEMEEQVLPLILQFDQKLAEYYRQIPDFTQMEQRVAGVESKLSQLATITEKIRRSDTRLKEHESMIKQLAGSIVTVGESLNSQVSGIYSILHEKFEGTPLDVPAQTAK